MRTKILKIIALLAVMVTMTGVASAYITVSPPNIEVDINDPNPPTIVTVTYEPQVGGDIPTGLDFTIKDGQYGTGSPTTEIIGSVDGGSSYIGNTGTMAVGSPISGVYTWNFYVKDNFDSDDTSQLGKKYRIQFNILGTADSVSYLISSTPTVAKAIPEFPTVALPVAAVIGLVFFFHQRKNKKV